MEEKKEEISHFHASTCPQCAGAGCDICRQFGLMYWYSDLEPVEPEEYSLYWGKTINWQHIAD